MQCTGLAAKEEYDLAELAGWQAFTNWLTRYGGSASAFPRPSYLPVCEVAIELDPSLSAAFNFGYSDDGDELYLAVAAEEYQWLARLPFEEFIITQSAIHLCMGASRRPAGETRLPSVCLRIQSDQMT